jgi:hypothetical protein
MKHPLYESTARCSDLPELLPQSGEGEVEMVLPESDPERVAEAVSARQADGGRLQEKVDGCWCCMTIDANGYLRNPMSRANLRLRYAAEWEGRQVSKRFAGWRIVGELDAATNRARRRREAREDKGWYGAPLFHVYALVTPRGELLPGQEMAAGVGQMIGLEFHGRIRPVAEALPGESWGDFTRRVFEDSGEGVVIRTPGGAIFRAKPQADFDRFVSKIVNEPDSRGHVRRMAVLSVCISAGDRPRFKAIQKVEMPKGWKNSDVIKRVVVVVGDSLNRETGAIRHARIVDVRSEDDKQPVECKL